ncbi:thiamine pyrophosphate-dependent enzyme [Paenibacillus sp. MABNR03]|uniref:thiamine pyrophosphate-dependent enzyme n=1 Tax=Paenibacillus sp. MABNR03 TaxID=3142626 RepID=UPI003D2BAE75
MRKIEVIEKLITDYPDAHIISTCGYITRDLYNASDRPEHFYMVGSMGMAAPIALGLAKTNPHNTFIVLDGDGSFVMNFGITLMIAEHKPSNLIHIVLDNEMHESTGGQHTVPISNSKAIMENIGYNKVHVIESLDQFPEIVEEGPVMIHCKVEANSGKIGKRVEWTPQEIVKRFTSTLAVSVS